MYTRWQIKASDVASHLNRSYTFEEREIIRAAEELGYSGISVNDELIEGRDEDGRLCVIAER